ncbi:U-scoloptoxin(01)-Er1a-like isoform X2 [Achroia grisella]|uniref:U-scoloptoxin(01)-Er1a-like isoform X2 n=1 Tax=Achroia grisella TaxID=688607 RepID=UPI0027D2ECD3|nr:U-scoloptoxin(01)-Er1a-like isoform X2 [Achroia grisella]
MYYLFIYLDYNPLVMYRCTVVLLLAFATALCQLPYDYYHVLHLPHDPPLHPVLHKAPRTDFSCASRTRGYYADVHTGCQAYHFCWRHRLVSTDLCANGTLFNEQFQVCDHFYNVRCGSPYIDL